MLSYSGRFTTARPQTFADFKQLSHQPEWLRELKVGGGAAAGRALLRDKSAAPSLVRVSASGGRDACDDDDGGAGQQYEGPGGSSTRQRQREQVDFTLVSTLTSFLKLGRAADSSGAAMHQIRWAHAQADNRSARSLRPLGVCQDGRSLTRGSLGVAAASAPQPPANSMVASPSSLHWETVAPGETRFAVVTVRNTTRDSLRMRIKVRRGVWVDGGTASTTLTANMPIGVNCAPGLALRIRVELAVGADEALGARLSGGFEVEGSDGSVLRVSCDATVSASVGTPADGARPAPASASPAQAPGMGDTAGQGTEPRRGSQDSVSRFIDAAWEAARGVAAAT